jgi:hypothetical protein
MIRIVGYVVPDASMTQTETSRWFVIWEAPPQLSASRALKQAASRLQTWEQRLKIGSYNGVTRIALQAFTALAQDNPEEPGYTINALTVAAGWGGK